MAVNFVGVSNEDMFFKHETLNFLYFKDFLINKIERFLDVFVTKSLYSCTDTTFSECMFSFNFAPTVTDIIYSSSLFA